MAIRVRIIWEEDVPAVNNLSEQLGYPQTEAATAKHIRDVLDSHDDCAYIALEGNQILGWIHGFKTRRIETGTFVEIGGLVVDDKSRGKGVGKVLVAAVRDWSRAQGISTLKVRSNVIRTEAHRFYTQQGFRESKEQKVFEQDIEM